MEYINSEKASKKWNISQRRIVELALKGRIKGAKKLGRSWLIPDNVDKPIDERTKSSKANKTDNDYFRYPDYAFKDISLYNPPLSKEELTIKKSMELFYSCDYSGANDALGNLCEEANNKYLSIYALYVGCIIDVTLCNISRFISRYQELYSKLSDNSLHKKELSYLIEEINVFLGYDGYFKDNFSFDESYDYDYSFLNHLLMFTSVKMFYNHEKINELNIKELELTIKSLEGTKNITDLQSTYVYLGNTYSLLNRKEEMSNYYTKAFEIAAKYNSFFPLCQQYYYLPNTFDYVLENYSKEFKNKIVDLSNNLHKRYTKFFDALSLNNIYTLLPSDYYPLLYYAVQGYSNKEVADILHKSKNYIDKKYSKMYDIASVKNRNELIDLYKKEMDISILTKK